MNAFALSCQWGRCLCFWGKAALAGGGRGNGLLFSRPAPGDSHGGSYRVPKAARESSPICKLFTSLCSHPATTISFCQQIIWPTQIPREGKQTPAMVGGAAKCCGYCFSIYVATLRFCVFEKEIDLEVQGVFSPICNRLFLIHSQFWMIVSTWIKEETRNVYIKHAQGGRREFPILRDLFYRFKRSKV